MFDWQGRNAFHYNNNMCKQKPAFRKYSPDITHS
jgi:hypothetical protein